MSGPTSSDVHVPTAGAEGRTKPHKKLPPAVTEAQLIKSALLECDCDPDDLECLDECDLIDKAVVAKMAPGMPAPSGVMIALMIPEAIAEAIAVPGGEPVEDLHLTIAYIPKIGGDQEKMVLIQQALAPIAETLAPLVGGIGGVGKFNATEASEGREVYYASFNSPGLEKLRVAVLDALAKVGIEPSNRHGFTPHITLKYLEPGEAMPTAPVSVPPFPVDNLCVGWAEGKSELPLVGTIVLKSGKVAVDLAALADDQGQLPAQLPHADGSAEKVTAYGVLENQADPEQTMAEVIRILAPGGVLSYAGPEQIECPEGMTEETGEEIKDGSASWSTSQVFVKGDPALADDTNPAEPVAQPDLPPDVALALAAVGYAGNDPGAIAAGNAHFGYPSQGGQPLAETQVAKRDGLLARLRNALKGYLNEHEVEKVLKTAVKAADVPGGGAQPDPFKENVARLDRIVAKAASAFHAQPSAENRSTLHDAVLARNSAATVAAVDQEMTSAKGGAVQILKADVERQIVYGVVLEPDTEDSQGDVISADDIEETAHNYLIDSRVVGSGHTRAIKAQPVESFIAPVDYDVEGPHGKQTVKKGSWVLAAKVNDPEEWEKIKAGDYTGWSVGGMGLRRPMS